ncbi:hypothetical protein CTAYLR_008975 [Chrysophaeum taylorii]|uniref:WW domain-containing protein n=1 Tax=Chrysophaeum taylorii TaxID=2483200 RepID=A0AAD7UKN8_9STRA|nr:hypothetical protein CTAYLR_008975 [Chrysophaeum taylorii]
MGRTEEEVKSLVASVTEHVKFKQLAVYSIDTLTKVLGPPNPHWREYIDIAIDIDAASVIIKVIKRHKGNEAVLTAGTRCLAKLAADATNATIIGEEGGVDAVLESMATNEDLDEEVLLHSLHLIDKMCNHPKSIEKIVTPGMVVNITKVMEHHYSKPETVEICARILEKMTRTQHGMDSIVAAEKDSQAVSRCCAEPLKAIVAGQKKKEGEKRSEDDEDAGLKAGAVSNITKVYSKLVGVPELETATQLRELGAQDALLECASIFPEDEKMGRSVAKLLSKVIKGGVPELVAQIKGGATDPRLLQLLGAISRGGEMSEEIALAGGVSAVVGALETKISARATEDIVRMITRLATSAKNLDEILASGCIGQLVGALVDGDAELKGLVLQAMSKICAQARTSKPIAEEKGAVEAILKTLDQNADQLQVARHGLAVADALLRDDDDDDEEEDKNKSKNTVVVVVEPMVVLKAMKNFPDHDQTQIVGTKVLSRLGGSDLLKAGALDVVLHNLDLNAHSPELLTESLELIGEKLADADPGSVAKAAFDAVVAAVCARPDDLKLRNAAIKLVSRMSDAEVAARVEAVEALEPNDAKLPLAAMSLGVLAMVPANVPKLASANAARPLVRTLGGGEALAVEDLVPTVGAALLEMLPASPAGWDAFPTEEALRAAVGVVRGGHASEDAVVSALRLVEAIAASHVSDDACLEAGVVEACAKAVARETPRVMEPAISALHVLVATRADQLYDRNAARPCINVLEAAPLIFDQKEEEDLDVLGALKVLEKVGSLGPEQAKRVGSQGAAKAVFGVMDAKADEPDVVAQCEKTLKYLVSEADVLDFLTKNLAAIPLDQVSRGDPASMRSANADVSKLGLLMMCGDFGDLVRSNGGPETLAAILKHAVAAPENTKTKANLVRGCIEALGRAAATGVFFEDAIELVPSLVFELSRAPSVDVVKAVASLVGDPMVCAALVDHGCVAALLPQLDSDDLREPVLACLASLVANSTSGAREVAEGGALPFVCDYVSDQLAATSGDNNNNNKGKNTKLLLDGAVGQAVKLLSALVEHGDAATILDAGTLRVVDQILDELAEAPEATADIEAVCGLVKGLATRHPGDLADKMVSGSARKLLSVVSGASVEAPDLLEDLGDLLEVLTEDPGTAEKLEAVGAQEVLVGAMNARPNDVAVASRCASALSKLSGGAGKQTGLSAVLGACDDLDDLADLANSVALASNLVLQPGAVSDQAAADDVVATIGRVLDKLNGMPVGDAQQEAVASTLSMLSRLMNVEGIQVPDDLALDCIQGALLEFDDDARDVLKAAACASLQSMCVRGGPAAVASVAKRGLLAKVQDAAAAAAAVSGGGEKKYGSTAPSGLVAEAESALKAMRSQAVSNAAVLAADPNGAQALSALLGGVPLDDLDSTLDDICEVGGGAQALLEALAQTNQEEGYAKPDEPAATAIVKQLQEIAAADPNQVVPWKIEHVAALCRARKGLPGCDDCLSLHEPTLATPEGAALCFGNYEPLFDELVCEDLAPPPPPGGGTSDDDDENAAKKALVAASLVAKGVAQRDPTCNAGLVGSGVPRALVSALKSKPRKFDEPFVQNALYGLNGLADALGVVEPLDLPKDAARVVGDAMKAHPDSEYVQATGQALLDKLKGDDDDARGERLEAKLENIPDFLDAAADWQQIASTDGVYYYNGRTGESSWDQPPDHMAFMNELDEIGALVDDLEGDLSTLRSPEATTGLVGALGTHARDAGVMGRVANILNAVGKNHPDALDDLADLDGLENLVAGLEHCGFDEKFVDDATELLDKLSRLDKMKAKLTLREYVRVLNQTSLDHMASRDVVSRCLSILANLAFNNSRVIGYEMEFNVPYTLKWALQQHLVDVGVCEIAVFCASCLLTDDEPQKIYVCDQLASEMTEALKSYATEESFFTKTMRCMGSLSIVDQCIMTMISRDVVVPLVVEGMDVHSDAPKALRNAVELISNFGAVEDEACDERATAAIVDGGAIEGIHRVLDSHQSAQDAPLMTACFDALYNVGNDERAARKITDQGLCEVVLSCLEMYGDLDRELLRQCVKLVSVLTYNDFSVERLTEISAATSLLDAALAAHSNDEEVVVDSVLSLSNLVTVRQTARVFLDKTYLKDVLELLDVYDKNAEVVKFVVVTLVRLATDDELSQKIAEDGMPYVMRTTAAFVEDAEVLSLVFELLGQLAYVKSNLRALVGAGGIKVLLSTLETFDDDPELVVKAIATLDNLVSADVEYATVVVERDGEGLLKECAAKWVRDPPVVRATETTLLSIQAMIAQKEKQRTNRAALFARLGDDEMDVDKLKTAKLHARETAEPEPRDDPLRKYREMFAAGTVFKQWDKGKAANRMLLASADWAALLTRDTTKGAAIHARIPLDDLRAARYGFGENHLVKSMISKKTKPTAPEDRCFYLTGYHNAKAVEIIAGECAKKVDRDRLVDALSTLFKVATLWPHRLVNG